MSALAALERCRDPSNASNTSSHQVFEAEKQIAKPGSYHRKCFTCAECKHQMDPTNFANGPDNEVKPTFIFLFLFCSDLLRPLLRADPWEEGEDKVDASGHDLHHGGGGVGHLPTLLGEGVLRREDGGGQRTLPSPLLPLLHLQPTSRLDQVAKLLEILLSAALPQYLQRGIFSSVLSSWLASCKLGSSSPNNMFQRV